MRYLTNTFVLITLILSVNVYAKCAEGDCENGKGVYTFSDGTVYEGDFLNGENHGKGKITFPNGNVYEGDYLNGVNTGNGAGDE